MGTLDNIFSEKNLMSYSKACFDLATEIPETFHSRELDTLVIPSRGAFPFFLGMAYGIKKIAEEGLCPHGEEFYKNLGVQESLLPLLPKDSGIRKGNLEDKTYRVLLAPFTADLDMTKIDRDEDTNEYTLKTRRYWAKVTAAMFLPEEQRKENHYFRSFTDVVLRHIEKRENVAKLYEKFPAIRRFGIMDTVISGRASNNILKAFDSLAKEKDNEDLKPYAFLIIDENEKKLRPDFGRYLRDKEVHRQASFYPIPRIVSEDENASLLGVGAVVYPTIMKASKEMLTIDGKEFFIGAGSWRLDEDLGSKRNNPHLKNFNQFMDLIYSGIDLELYGEEKRNEFRDKRESFLDTAKKNNIFGRAVFDLKHISKQTKYKPVNPYETGSFVLHVPFDKKATRKIISELGEMEDVSVGTGTGAFKMKDILKFKQYRKYR
jgi:hypothetical protein